jgi:hypothetical protein
VAAMNNNNDYRIQDRRGTFVVTVGGDDHR